MTYEYDTRDRYAEVLKVPAPQKETASHYYNVDMLSAST